MGEFAANKDIDKWTCQVKRDSLTVDSLVEKIDKGYSNQSGGIVLDPIYQREYKFTTKKESSIIESLILNIPIPVIYLSQDFQQDRMMFNVIDGMHRCKSIYRYIKNEYKLTGLEILSNFNGCKFSQLPKIEQNKLLYNTQLEVNSINISDNHELEYEVFLRFNQQTNPLKPQELLEVMYRSEYSYWFKDYILDLAKKNLDFQTVFNTNGTEGSSVIKNKTIINYAYACMAYGRYGIKEGKNDTPQYVTLFMSEMQKNDETKNEDMKIYTKEYIGGFIKLYSRIGEIEKISYPISKEFITRQVPSGAQRFLISFLIPLTIAYDYCRTRKVLHENMGEDEYRKIYFAITAGMKKIGFGDFGGVSSTSIKIQSACTKAIKSAIDSTFRLVPYKL